jgi:hypothetical protein
MSKFDPAVTLPQTIDFITEAQTLVVGDFFGATVSRPYQVASL